jgi:hypothetical protein
MLSAIGSHVRRNLVGYVAIFLALGGTGYAATKIGTNKIKNGAVTTKKLHNKAVTKRKLAKNLGLVQGNGQLFTSSVTENRVGLLPNPDLLASIPGFGKVNLRLCGTSAGTPTREMRVQLVSDDNASNFFYSAEVRSGGVPAGTGQPQVSDTDGGTLGGGGGTVLATPNFTPNGFTLGREANWDFQLWRRSGGTTTGAHVVVGAINSDLGNQCQVSAQTLIQK